MSALRPGAFPLGAAVTLNELDRDPHAVHHRLRATEPVSWLPVLDGWLVTTHAHATQAMRDAVTFTVDDPRFATAQVVGPSMLSLDGSDHARHRAPFIGPFRAAAVSDRFAAAAATRARELCAALSPAGRGELRRGFAGPMAAAIVARALGMDDDVDEVLGWYDAIVASVAGIATGAPPTPEGSAAFATLRARLEPVIAGERGDCLLADAAHGDPAAPAPDLAATTAPRRVPATGAPLSRDEVVANAAVLLFGGIETTEGMIAGAALELLTRPGELERLRADPAGLDAVIDESLRLEPTAAVIDRYATVDTQLGDAEIRRGDFVRISLAAANRDPAVFPDPDRYDPARPNLRRQLAFAQGPHVCVGVHLARLEARAALAELLRLPGLTLAPDARPRVRGIVFRKVDALDAVWDA